MINNIRNLISTLLLILFLSAPSNAQPSPAGTPSGDVAVLKAQLETTRQFQDSFMSMAQWTLGTAVAVALALAAFSWYGNKASYERDRDALRREIDALKKELSATVLTEVEKTSRRIDESLATRETAIRTATEKALQPKLDRLQASVAEVASDVLDLQASAVEAEARDAQERKRYCWAIVKYSEFLDLCVKRQTDFYEASDVIDEIRKIVKLPDAALDADTVNTAVASLNRLPKVHHAATESLIESLKRALG